MTHQQEMPEWDDLQDIWQDSPEVDMQRMARHARFVWWRMRINFVLELLVCTVGIGVLGWDLTTQSTPVGYLFDITFILFCLGGIWAAFYIRKGAWGEPDGTALSLVELQIRRARSAIRYIVMNNWGCLAGVFALGLGYWMMYDKLGTFDHEDMRGMNILAVSAGAMFVLFPVLTRPYVQKKQKQIEQLSEMADQLRAGEEG